MAGDAATDSGPRLPDAPPPACDDPNPCACADRGPADYSRARSGEASATSDESQVLALTRANRWRTAAGLSPFNASAQIEQAATAHARFMATTPQAQCWPNPHNENQGPGCDGFTGRSMADRMTAAGYSWSRASEVIDWEATPETAVDGWIWTVYHRQPFMDWHLVDVGYGREEGPFGGRPAQHNVMDFGTPQGDDSARAPRHPVVFPVPGQVDVPPAFRGDLEGPTPPGPGGGAWPRGVSSGTVVSVHFPHNRWNISSHRLLRVSGGMCEEVPHTFISHENDDNLNRGTPSNDVFLYANQPLDSQVEYVVRLEGTFDGFAWNRTWAFTTR
jgi:hypothetical protein